MKNNPQNEQGINCFWRCVCGQVNEEPYSFCTNCGRPRAAGQQTETAAFAYAGQQPAFAPHPRRKNRWLVPALALLVIAAIAVGLLLWAPWKSKSQAVVLPVTVPVSGTAGQTDAEPPASPAEEPISPYAGVYDITVFASEGHTELIRRQIERFNAENPYGIIFRPEILAVAEWDVADQLGKGSRADLFVFHSTFLRQLKLAGELASLSGEAADFVRESNDAGSARAVEVDGSLYAYPITLDNGFFLYYDKSVIPDGDVGSMEKILDDCEAAGKAFAFEVTNAWYGSSFFFGTGCVSEWEFNTAGQVTAFRDSFASYEGLIALKGMQKLLLSPAFQASANANEFHSGAAAVVSGTWDYNNAREALGENLGIAELPSFTVDGRSYHLGSFAGYKLLGVMPQADETRAAALDLLARYLSGESCQIERFETLGWIPSNRNAQQGPAVIADPAANALARQNAFATAQGVIYGEWWSIASEIPWSAQTAPAGDEDALWAILTEYSREIQTSLGTVPNEAAGWCVIGSICGTMWDTDFPMIEVESGFFVSERMHLFAGDEFKVRKDWSWDENVGVDGQNGANYVVETEGDYYVVLDEASQTIYLIDD